MDTLPWQQLAKASTKHQHHKSKSWYSLLLPTFQKMHVPTFPQHEMLLQKWPGCFSLSKLQCFFNKRPKTMDELEAGWSTSRSLWRKVIPTATSPCSVTRLFAIATSTPSTVVTNLFFPTQLRGFLKPRILSGVIQETPSLWCMFLKTLGRIRGFQLPHRRLRLFGYFFFIQMLTNNDSGIPFLQCVLCLELKPHFAWPNNHLPTLSAEPQLGRSNTCQNYVTM